MTLISKPWVWPTISWTPALSASAITRSQSEIQRQRLFDEDMLAVAQSLDRLVGMKRMRRADIDRLDIRIPTQIGEVSIGLRVEIAGERLARPREWIGPSH